MKNSKYFLGKRKQKKGQGRSHLWKAEGGSHMMGKHGDRSSLRHSSVSDGVSSQCALGSAVLSSPESSRPPPAPAWRPASVSWLHHPAPTHTRSAPARWRHTRQDDDSQCVETRRWLSIVSTSCPTAWLLLFKISKCKTISYAAVEITGNIFVTSWLFCLRAPL